MIKYLRPAQVRAYTLLELIVTLALMALLLTVIFEFLVPTLRITSRAETRLEMQEQAMVALARLTTDLSRSTEAGLSLDDSSLVRTASPLTMLPDPPASIPSSVTLVMQQLPEPKDPQCPNAPSALTNCGGEQLWSTFLVAYCWDSATKNLYRKEYDGKAFKGISLKGLVDYYPQRLLSAEVDLVGAAQYGEDPNDVDQEVLATDVQYFVITMANWGGTGLLPPCPSNPNGVGYVIEPLNIEFGMQRTTASGARKPETFSIQRWVATRNTFPNAPVSPTCP